MSVANSKIVLRLWYSFQSGQFVPTNGLTQVTLYRAVSSLIHRRQIVSSILVTLLRRSFQQFSSQ